MDLLDQIKKLPQQQQFQLFERWTQSFENNEKLHNEWLSEVKRRLDLIQSKEYSTLSKADFFSMP